MSISLQTLLAQMGVANDPRLTGPGPGGSVAVYNPANNQQLAVVGLDDAASYEAMMERSVAAFEAWRDVPAPVRGQIVREIGEEFRTHKQSLGSLVSLEVGKILQEGLGEVQETIDIADFAVGLSRQCYGLTMPSERPKHRMFEQWLPLGPIGVISAFNFPNAVWAWNAMLAAVCGDSVVWKPSVLAPLTAIASNALASRVAARHGHPHLFQLTIGKDNEIGERLTSDRRIPLISATGSCRMGKAVGAKVAQRLARCLLELGGNNAVVIDAGADLSLTIPAVVFAAVGTAGQRCTSTRRLIVHESIVDEVTSRLVKAYSTITIGDPLRGGTLVGPVINSAAMDTYDRAIASAVQQGGRVLIGGKRIDRPGNYVEPTIIRAPANNRLPVSDEETFAPILYIFTFSDLQQAITMNNSVQQGLSSAIFTDSLRNSERFLSASGSDCGIANVNIGTSGAEIGGAFGGEKDTGGGRESGSDSWKAYMRRQTCTVNHGNTLSLAQGIKFGE